MKTVAELPGLTWTESLHPSFAKIEPKDIVPKLISRYSFRGIRDRAIHQADTEPLNRIQYEIGKIANLENFLFMQIGAHNGVYDDGYRKYLQEFPWRGVLVEPQEELYYQLAALYIDRPEIVTIRTAVASEQGSLKLWRTSQCEDMEFGTAIACLDAEQVRKEVKRCLGGKALHNITLEQVSVPAVTLDQVFSDAITNPNDVNLFVCDTEGQDPPIVKQLLDLGVQPDALQYEHLHAKRDDVTELDKRLVDAGYSLIKTHKDTFASA